MQPEVWFEEISTPRPGCGQGRRPWDSDPDQAELPEQQLLTLCQVLAAHTGSNHAWYCLWEGWGWLHCAMLRIGAYAGDDPPPPSPGAHVRPLPAFPPEILHGPKVRMPDFDRTYLLFEGPIDAARELGGWVDWGDVREFERQLPSLWWPDDRAWRVASEIDFEVIYVGGSPG